MRRSSKKTVLVVFSAAAAVVGGLGARQAAADTLWVAPVSTPTDFFVPGAWNPATVPTTGTASVSNGGTCLINASDGTITLGQLWAGDSTDSPKGTGTINQTGDTVNVTVFLSVGHNGNSQGTYLMSGGIINETGASAAGVRIYGNASAGAAATQFQLSGSGIINDIGTFDVGYKGTNVGAGTLNMSAGTINTTGSSNDFTVANGAGTTGVFLFSGGTVNAADNIVVGGGLGGNGTLNMSGGTINSTTTSNEIAIGSGLGSVGQFLLSGSNSVVNANGNFWVGNVSTGTVIMSNGTVNLNTSGNLSVGQNNASNGIFSMTGGTFNASGQMWMGNQTTVKTDAGDQATGLFQISGGVVNSSNYVAIGRANNAGYNNSVGTLNISGGTFIHVAGSAGNFQVGSQGVGINATLNLNGGTLITDRIADQSSGGTQIINFNGGMVQANDSDTGFIRGTTQVATMYVGNGGANFNSSTFAIGLTTPLLHSPTAGTIDGGLTKYGTGSLTLGATNTYTGPTNVLSGSLIVNGGISSSSLVTVQSGATLSGLGTINSPVTINSGAFIQGGNSSGGTLASTGGLTLSGGSTVTVANLTSYASPATPSIMASGLNYSGGSINLNFTSVSGALAAGNVYDLIGYTSETGIAPTYVLPVNLPSRAIGSISDNGSMIQLTINSTDYLKWTGVASGSWDTTTGNGTPSGSNWALNSSGGAATYIDNPGDVVVFDDSATNTNITMATALNPSSVTFNNSNLAYSLSGVGGINGSTGVTKLGTNTVTLDTVNTYTGPTMIENGTVILGTGGSLAKTTAVTLGNGVTSGVLVLGDATGAVNQTIASLTTSGTGTGNEVIGGNAATASILTIATATNTVNYPGLLGSGIAGASTANSLGLNKTGAGTLILNGSNTYTGGTSIANGIVSINTSGTLGTGPITFTNSGVGGTTNLGSGSILALTNVNLTNNFNIGAGAAVFNTSGNTITLSGSIINTAGTVAQVMQPIGGGNFILGGTFNVSGSPTDSNNPALLMASPGETTTINGSGNLSGISMGWYNSTNTLILQPNGPLNLTNAGVSLYSGQTAGGNGYLIQNSGTINLSGNLGLAAFDGSYTTFVINGGTLNVAGNFAANSIGNNNGNSYIQMSGGVVNVNGQTKIGFAGTGASTLYMTGGTFNSPGANFIVASAPSSNAVLTLAGGSLDVVNLNLASNSQSLVGGAILNLNGTGTVVATSVKSTSAGAYSYVNFNGGTLQAGNLSPNLLNFVNQANIYSGGATFNSAGNSVTIPQNLVGAAVGGSMGFTTAPALNSTGSGYVGIPVVTVTGGGGTGATAIATVSGGMVTGITMTSPGVGYTGSPSINIIGAAGSGASFTATQSNNAADGGVTKIGPGMLTLSGSNTYTGGTFVKGGTLGVANPAALGSGAATLSDQTTLALVANAQLTSFFGDTVNTGTVGNGLFKPVLSNGGNGPSVLMTSSLQNEVTSVFSGSEYTISDTTGFAASFIYNHGSVGAQGVSANGITFTIQNSPQGSSALNGSQGALGYGGSGSNASSPGITSSVAAAVDVYDNQLQVGQSGVLNLSSGIGSVPFISQSPACLVTINYSYNASAGTGSLSETISSLSNTSSYTFLATSIDVPQLLGGTAGGTGQGYIGFTGSTGGVDDAQMISNFAFTNTASVLTPLATNISNPVVVLPASSSMLQLAGTNLYSSGSVGTITIGTGSTLAVTSNSAGGALRGVLTTPSISFITTGNGILDVGSNSLDITNMTLAQVNQLVASGYQGGNWEGAGIASSAASLDSTHLTALGVIQNNQSGTALFSGTTLFDGASPGAGDILVKYTYYGDSNLDGKVDGSDYSLIDNGYLSHGALTGWYNGDYNYDGVVDGSDYTLIDNAFNMQGVQYSAQLATATALIGGSSGSSAVPEPASIGLLAIGAAALLGRRRQPNRGRDENRNRNAGGR